MVTDTLQFPAEKREAARALTRDVDDFKQLVVLIGGGPGGCASSLYASMRQNARHLFVLFVAIYSWYDVPACRRCHNGPLEWPACCSDGRVASLSLVEVLNASPPFRLSSLLPPGFLSYLQLVHPFMLLFRSAPLINHARLQNLFGKSGTQSHARPKDEATEKGAYVTPSG